MKKILLLSLAIAFFIIGVYETMTYGIIASYWLFMLCGGILLYSKLSGKKAENTEAGAEKKEASATAKKVKDRLKRAKK